MLKKLNTRLQDLLLFETGIFWDDRGYFRELWHDFNYKEVGINAKFMQDNMSFSKKYVLRGLHFQNPQSQGKLISVIKGSVFDVVVDLRKQSPTFLQWESIILSDTAPKVLYVPPGFAHGFIALSEETIFLYKCTELYNPKNEHTLLWNDPELNIDWPVSNPIISSKDGNGKKLKDLKDNILF